MGEGPANSFERQTPGNLRVFEYIFAVIIINELVAKRLPKDQPCNCGQENTNAEDHPTIGQASAPISGLQRGGSAAMSRRCSPWSNCFFGSPAHSMAVALPAMWKIQHRARIMHSRVLRRLEYETQVSPIGAGDRRRTRLTHSIEVASTSRTYPASSPLCAPRALITNQLSRIMAASIANRTPNAKLADSYRNSTFARPVGTSTPRTA